MSYKISTFLRECFVNSRGVPSPDEEIYNSVLENDRKHVSIVDQIDQAIRHAGKSPESELDSEPIEAGGSKEKKTANRIDAPLRDITINTFFKLFHIGNYYCSLLSPKSDNKKFLREILQVGDLLIRNAIFDEVYMAYGEDLVELDKEIIMSKNDVKGLFKARLTTPFRLYTINGSGEIYSILASSKLEDKSGKLLSRLVKFSIGDGNYWLEGWHILYETIGGFERVKNVAKFVPIRTVVCVVEGEEDFNHEMSSAADSIYPALKKKGPTASINKAGQVSNAYAPHEFVPVDLPKQLLEFYQSFFDIQTDYLGFAGKSSPYKKERLTEVESAQGASVVAAIQQYLCQRISSCFDVCRGKFLDFKGESIIPDDFEIFITSKHTWSAILEPDRGDILKAKPKDPFIDEGQNNQGAFDNKPWKKWN